MKRREHGDGGIDERGPDTFRLRYRLNGKRYSKTFHGNRAGAKTELRRLIRSGDTGEHIEPDQMTVGQWIAHWLSIGAPGRRKKKAGPRTHERYSELLNCHVVPTLGPTKIQKLSSMDVDKLYEKLEPTMAPRTAHHVHTVFNACLSAATRKGIIFANPIDRAEKLPSPGESNHGQVLDEEQLAHLVQGFRDSTLYPIIAIAAYTGARRNEILALRWSDLDPAKKTLRIERALEKTKKFGRRVKEPKTARGRRTIEIDAGLLALLVAERAKHLRLVAGVPDGLDVDLSLVRLPEGALMFPGAPDHGAIDLTRLRAPHVITHEFVRNAARLGFPKLRFHDLRGSHETILLDKGVPVHVVAARCGHDPAVLLRTYAKRTRKADTNAAAVIADLSKAALL
ncbi:tyrosine-type recombinase/integrase [Rhodoplanes sp. Z2-YC6860]|uniref:tyrosine-type recombinase/integrase n=1 Tax=Rhodoplanes sp. Z2-YC6860 TaxID=674703 RepID=UPI00078E7FFA|nr:site-specific integrase [Rhodoplanes sp. Z2-YC6860]AMN42063.1 Phage integrase [Rhodoplanes sp. Z2-YC6860]